jgi:hypothetical protein
MGKLDLRKELRQLCQPSSKAVVEGECVGLFSGEGPVTERLHDWIGERGRLCGKHHEIYLTDMRRAAPARWKTIIRQSMVRQPLARQSME